MARALLEVASTTIFVSAAALATPSCASIIGADDYDSIAIRVCQCEPVSAIPDCAGRVEQALANATPEVREAWLANVEVHRCEEECGGAAACIDAAPTCVPVGEACAVSVECCGAESPESGFSPSFCAGGVCTRDPAGCNSTLQACTEDEECCGVSALGSDGPLGSCGLNPFPNLDGRCVERCEPSAPSNCPGCCASILVEGVERGYACADAGIGVDGFSCDDICDEDSDCPSGSCGAAETLLPAVNVKVCDP